MYNQLTPKNVERGLQKIKSGSFRYCATRSGRKIRTRRWARYKNGIRIPYRIAQRGVLGEDYGPNWIRVTLGNVISLSRDYTDSEATEAFSGKHEPEKDLKIKFLYPPRGFDGGAHEVFMFRITWVKPDDTRALGHKRKADYSWFSTKFYFNEDIQAIYRKIKREFYNAWNTPMDDLTYKKEESGDYYLAHEKTSRRRIYLGRIYVDGSGGWKFDNFLKDQTEDKGPFSTRKKAKNELYHDLRT